MIDASDTPIGRRSPRGYRPDIDGLRAIAVLAVILFHLARQALPGGFVGVDIFFVISGFLITSHILGDVNRGRFSLAGFYRNRIKRIAPAMLVVVCATVVIAKAFMLPEDAAAVSKSGVWSLASLANIFFWHFQDTGYFATQAKELPLLHLWSLGIEEQFYMIWPLVIMGFYSAARARSFLIGMTVAAVVSYAIGDLLYGPYPAFAYYMLPTRAGELLLGAIASNSIFSSVWRRLPDRFMSPLSVAGLLLIAGSVAFLSESAVFPGMRALPPTLGAALMIATGDRGKSLGARLLSSTWLVRVGLVSYSAYLWHWPLMAFYRYGYGEFSALSAVLAFALTMFLAWATYRFVEQPTRRASPSALRAFTWYYAVPGGIIGLAALSIIYGDRLWPATSRTPYRVALEAVRTQRPRTYDYPYVCQRQLLSPADISNPRCVVGDSSVRDGSIVLWGDSNASHYIGVLGAFAQASGFRFRNVEVGSCPPIFADPAPFAESIRTHDCRASTRIVQPVLDAASTVIISSSWTEYQARNPRFRDAVFSTVRLLTSRGKHVILLGKAPIFPGLDRRCQEKALAIPFKTCPVRHAPLDAEVARFNDGLRDFASRTPGAEYYDVNTYLCPDGVCTTDLSTGEVAYYDGSHLSLPASWRLGQLIVDKSGVPPLFANLGENARGRIAVR